MAEGWLAQLFWRALGPARLLDLAGEVSSTGRGVGSHAGDRRRYVALVIP
jgi:hypothetical protein